jgi:hypothetical protein
METAIFKKNGGPIFAGIKSLHAISGNYTLYLWKSKLDHLVMMQKGNLTNTDGIKYEMPLPNEVNDQRIIDVFVSLDVSPPKTDYNIELEVTQDGYVIGRNSQAGQSVDKVKILNLQLKLEMEDRSFSG